jgi:hypothetical protein
LDKTRLVKHLHEKLGFDVLVFEGGFYEESKTWEMSSPAAMGVTGLRG